MSVISKIGFWPVVSIVIGSQIGSGIFMLPSHLGKYGAIGVLSWVVSGAAAIMLALVFSELCKRYPKTGGPHAYVEVAFGRHAAFFTAWSYWVISWLSSAFVVIAAVSYFGSIFGGFSQQTNLSLEIGLLLGIMSINLFGIRASGYTEFIFTVLKILPLLLLPFAALFFFKAEHFTPLNLSEFSMARAINEATVLTFWGFIGLEVATTPAGSIENPGKTVPRAIMLGTIIVAVIYFFSSSVIMGVIHPAELQLSNAPFVDLARVMFGGNWHVIIALAASVVCIGTLNAWVLASSQIALGAASDELFPRIFSKKNRFGASIIGVVISALGMIPVLCLMLKKNLVSQLEFVVDVSVMVFLLVYGVCAISYLIILKREYCKSFWRYAIGYIALAFCVWVLSRSNWATLGVIAAIVCSGIPVYFMQRKSISRIDLKSKGSFNEP